MPGLTKLECACNFMCSLAIIPFSCDFIDGAWSLDNKTSIFVFLLQVTTKVQELFKRLNNFNLKTSETMTHMY